MVARLMQYTQKMILGDVSFTLEGNYWTVKDTLRAIEIWYGVIYVSRGSYYNLLEM